MPNGSNTIDSRRTTRSVNKDCAKIWCFMGCKKSKIRQMSKKNFSKSNKRLRDSKTYKYKLKNRKRRNVWIKSRKRRYSD